MARATDKPEQLTLDVGGKRQLPPSLSTFRIGALASTKRELKADDEVLITIVDADGEVLVAQHGTVTGVAFKRHRPKQGPPWTERIHAIEIGDGEE